MTVGLLHVPAWPWALGSVQGGPSPLGCPLMARRLYPKVSLGTYSVVSQFVFFFQSIPPAVLTSRLLTGLTARFFMFGCDFRSRRQWRGGCSRLVALAVFVPARVPSNGSVVLSLGGFGYGFYVVDHVR